MVLKKILTFCVVLGLAGLASIPSVAGECCTVVTGTSVCENCKPPEFVYCGKPGGGGCNIFGCNCGGGCIKKSRWQTHRCGSARDSRDRRSVEDLIEPDPVELPGGSTGREVVLSADKDGDGMLDAVEVALYVERQGVPAGPDEWLQLDADFDGKLTAHEIDHDLEQHVDVDISLPH